MILVERFGHHLERIGAAWSSRIRSKTWSTGSQTGLRSNPRRETERVGVLCQRCYGACLESPTWDHIPFQVISCLFRKIHKFWHNMASAQILQGVYFDFAIELFLSVEWKENSVLKGNEWGNLCKDSMDFCIPQ